MASTIPKRAGDYPTLNHVKSQPYIDYPIVYNATVTTEPFYAEYDFTFATSTPANTTLYKWTGGGWVAVTGISNPELILGRGYYAVTTSANEYVSITEHYKAQQV